MRSVKADELSDWEPVIIKSTEAAATYLKRNWDAKRFLVQEEVYIMFLNCNNELLHYGLMSRGGTDACNFDIQIFLWEMSYHPLTKRVIISHNHPGKNATPSDKDIHNTTKLNTILMLMGVKLVDHIIFSPTGYFSFCQVGMIKELPAQY